jgi:suppressor of ftsI
MTDVFARPVLPGEYSVGDVRGSQNVRALGGTSKSARRSTVRQMMLGGPACSRTLGVVRLHALLPLPPLIVGAAVAIVSLTSCGQAGTAPAPAGFEPQSGRAFDEPEVLRSRRGRLRTTCRVEEDRFDVAGVSVRGKSYRGAFIGPTLRVRPGDTIEIRLVNRLGQSTNLHEHGFHVSPVSISDNVLRTMPAGTDDAVRVRLPRDMAPGTYWYHSHMHPLVEEQVFSGLAGVLIVEGLTDRLPPRLRRVPDRVLALKDLQVRHGAIVDENINSAAPTTRTVNGLVRPVLRARTNQTQLLRLANISADIWYCLRLDGAQFSVIAEDANPVGRVWSARELLLPPGKRYDVLVRWPRPGTYRLRTLRYSTGPAGDTYPERRLAKVRVAGAPVADLPWPRSMGPLPSFQRDHVRRVRHLTFSENAGGTKFFINGWRFDPSRIDEVVKLGTSEEWVIRNVSNERHPFHIHVNDFQVMSINEKPYRARGLQDTVPLPVGGVVRIRMRFRNFLGAYVYHCHILAHEDGGMMGIVDVTRTGRRPSPRTLRALRDVRRAMGMPAG